MLRLEVGIDKHPRAATFKALEKAAGKPCHDDTALRSAHYVVFLYDTQEEADAAEAKLLELDVVNGTNIDDYEED